MKPRIATRFLVALTLLAAPALAASDHSCERALAKASGKFVGAAFKSAQRCLLARSAGKLPVEGCRLGSGTGNLATDRAMTRAEGRLAKGLQPCADAELVAMGFPAACPRPAAAGAFTRADLNHCIATTHMAAVEALVGVQFAFPQQETTCGDGIVQDEEECDPAAAETDCIEGEVCVGPGSADECTCLDQGTVAVCGDGIKDATEQCDPTAIPTGCAEGQMCGAAGQQNACTCSDGGTTGPCEGTCTPACGAGQTCVCECVSQAPVCGDGIKAPTEQCDPAAVPTGCATGQTCGAAGAADQCTCVAASPCGNGVIDAGEMCDTALPNNCDPGEECHPSGPFACMCGAPTTACGNGRLEWGEDCDPAAAPPGCAAGFTCTATCTCVPGGTTTTVPGGTTTTTVPGATTTTVPGGTTTTTIGGGGCCGPERIVLTSSAGTLQVDNLPPFPFPTGVVTTMDTGAASAAPECRHDVIVPSGGFSVPNFDIPALNYCSSITTLGCESGNGAGAGALWDGMGNAGLAMTNVDKKADTSDGVCNPAGQPCTTAGAGANTDGDIDSTRSLSASGGVRSLLDIRVRSLTWSDATCSPAVTPGCCPTSNYNPADGDLLITQFDFILSPTTDRATASFADKNGDGCKRAGSGFANPTPDSAELNGTAAQGPCCVAGQATTVVSVGAAFSGGAPLFDLGFKSTIPNTVSSCGAATAGGTCTVTTDPCLQ